MWPSSTKRQRSKRKRSSLILLRKETKGVVNFSSKKNGTQLTRTRRSTIRSQFLKRISSILDEEGVLPQCGGQEGTDTILEAFEAHHQSLKSASLQLLRTVSTFQSSIKEIVREDMELEKSWEKEARDTEIEIKGMYEETRAKLEEFFQSQTSGWTTVMGGWEKKVAMLLENAPVLESSDGEEGMIGNNSVKT